MKIFAETERLILREILPEDVESIFLLDSDPEVHRYLGNNPIHTMEEAAKTIEFIRRQYAEYGIGRWAVISKDTNEFVGWSGLKFITEETNNHIDYYDLGYRFIRKYWGKGYATETAKASLSYAFQSLGLSKVFAIVDVENMASEKVLKKVGFETIERFSHQGIEHCWLKLGKEDWIKAFRII